MKIIWNLNFSIVLLEQTMLVSLHTIYGYIFATKVELHSCGRSLRPVTPKIFFCLVPYTKLLSTLVKNIAVSILFYFFLTWGHFFIPFRLTGREREKNIDVREKHQLVVSCTHLECGDHMCLDQGLNLQPRHVPWLGVEPTTSWLQDNTWSTCSSVQYSWLGLDHFFACVVVLFIWYTVHLFILL